MEKQYKKKLKKNNKFVQKNPELKKNWFLDLILLSPTTTGKQQADNQQQQPTTNNDHYSADHQPVHHQRGHWEGVHPCWTWQDSYSGLSRDHFWQEGEDWEEAEEVEEGEVWWRGTQEKARTDRLQPLCEGANASNQGGVPRTFSSGLDEKGWGGVEG